MNHEHIWLQPDCKKCEYIRCWSRNKLENCDECDAKPAEYIRADVAREFYAAGQKEMRERAARIGYDGCRRPPGGGSFTQGESDMCRQISENILAAKIKEKKQ